MSQSTMRPSQQKGRTNKQSSVSDATVQLAWRRRRTRRVRVIRLLVALLVLLLLGGAVWLVGFSSVLAVEKVSITGATTVLDEEEVTDAAAVPRGQPMARQDLDAVEARVRALKPVESVQVTREWPHTIRVAVTERRPLFAAGKDGSFMIIDRHGVSFQVVQEPPKGLLVADVDPAADERLLADLGVVAQALPPEVRKRVDTMRADSTDTIELVLKNGSVVTWGSAEQSELKATVTKALLKTKAKVYDVSAPAYPTTR